MAPVPAEVLAVFWDEADEHLATLTSRLRALKENPAAVGHWPELQRAAHTLKAAAAMVGFDAAARLTHELEGLFEPFADRPATADEIDDLLRTVAAIAAALPKTHSHRQCDNDSFPVAVLQRSVDHAAEVSGRRVRLVVEGDWSAVNRGVLEALLHLLRNAVDHGIEPSDVRRGLGKPEVGTVSVTVRRTTDECVITVADDGRGIEVGTEFQRLFDAGFTTKSGVTQVSGRGVGLAAVKAGIETLGGTVSVETTTDRGSTFTLRLPYL